MIVRKIVCVVLFYVRSWSSLVGYTCRWLWYCGEGGRKIPVRPRLMDKRCLGGAGSVDQGPKTAKPVSWKSLFPGNLSSSTDFMRWAPAISDERPKIFPKKMSARSASTLFVQTDDGCQACRQHGNLPHTGGLLTVIIVPSCVVLRRAPKLAKLSCRRGLVVYRRP